MLPCNVLQKVDLHTCPKSDKRDKSVPSTGKKTLLPLNDKSCASLGEYLMREHGILFSNGQKYYSALIAELFAPHRCLRGLNFTASLSFQRNGPLHRFVNAQWLAVP